MRLAVTGVGMVTSVGRSATAACAAIRAGISRPRGVRYSVLDEETQAMERLTGHPIHGYTEGFTQSALWLRLALGAVGDLLHSASLSKTDVDFWKRTGLLGVTPPCGGPRFQMEDEDPGLMEEALIHPLQKKLGVLFARRFVGLGGADHAGLALAVHKANTFIEAGLDRVLLVAVDSLIDALTLEWLDGAHRLKTSDTPSGLSPGEAGVALLLEGALSARRRRAVVLAELTAVGVGQEAKELESGVPSTGRGLAQSIRTALDVAGLPDAYDGDVFADLNGEVWRAHEWGMSLVQLVGRVGEAVLHLPAVQVGDTGAASGALGVVLATHSLGRGHTRRPDALVTSRSDSGVTGCIVLRRFEGPRERTS